MVPAMVAAIVPAVVAAIVAAMVAAMVPAIVPATVAAIVPAMVPAIVPVELETSPPVTTRLPPDCKLQPANWSLETRASGASRRLDIPVWLLYNSEVKVKRQVLTEKTGKMSPKSPGEKNVLADEEKARLEAEEALKREEPPKPKSKGFHPAIGVLLLLLFVFMVCGIWLRERPHRPVLEVSGFRWGKTGDGHHVEARGQVKNISRKSLNNVTAVVTFNDKRGGSIASYDAMIEDDSILPGQTSSFCITETYNPAMRGARVEFKYMMGGTIPTRDKGK